MSDQSTIDAQREFAVEVVRALRDAGHQALWAGGCVRDQLLGVTPKDYDVATSARPDEVRDVFGRRRTLPIGAAFGVITVLGPKRAGQIEVATFRTETDYTDGRRPNQVEFTTAEHDASRRDFTINGLFYDPIEDRLIDYVGGQSDLQANIVRAIGDPTERFDEDKLRMLRAVRFAATLGFEIDPSTAEAIVAHAAEIRVVSAERIGAELRRMLTHPSCPDAIKTLRALGLATHVLPELAAMQDAELEKFRAAYAKLGEPSSALALAVLLAPLAEATAVRAAAVRLKFTKKEADRSAWLVKHFPELASADTKPWSVVQPLLAHDGGSELVQAYEAIHQADQASSFCHQKVQLPAEQLDPTPLLTGDDLVRQGFKPGPDFASHLRRVRAAQLDGEIRTADEALALVLRSQSKG